MRLLALDDIMDKLGEDGVKLFSEASDKLLGVNEKNAASYSYGSALPTSAQPGDGFLRRRDEWK